ncbi:MAG: heme-binding protein [Acidobacteriota bacterium]|nr:heme-binding protein [Acidobacteriota bacterium]
MSTHFGVRSHTKAAAAATALQNVIAFVVMIAIALPLHAQRVRAVGKSAPSPAPVIKVAAEPPGCAATPLAQVPCADGGTAASSLSAAEVEAIVRGASGSIDGATVAVVDRAGRPLAVFRKAGVSSTNDELAVGVARTAAFFSHNQAPLSSRTVRFISGIHFPPGITNTPSAALYGIENTNRGCDFNVTFDAGKCIPRARSIALGAVCAAGDTSGCGPGIVTGKRFPNDSDPDSINAGGLPLYRVQVSGSVVSNGQLLGGIGVISDHDDPERAEFAAANGAFASLGTGIVPVPFFPLPAPGNVFIDGIRLPFLGPNIGLRFNDAGVPNGVTLHGLASAATLPDLTAVFALGPFHGGCAANEDLVSARAGAGGLSLADVQGIVQRGVETAKRTRAAIRLPLNRYARMVIAVADLDGSIIALHRMPDATVFSVDVAVAKARNVIRFSKHGIGGPVAGNVPAGTAVSNRTIGFGAQPFYPPGIDSGAFDPEEGPWYQTLFVSDLQNACTQGDELSNPNQNGVVFFAGSSPLYRNGTLIGGLGVSGDGIEQDDYVTYFAAGPFLPPQNLWADQLIVDGARLPMFKFPRHAEGVTECGGGPCS